MVTITQGNLLRAEAETLVNTVNCVGYMGKGIALQFKQAFPENFAAYHKACRAGEVRPGKMFVFETGLMTNPRYIINFPTKRHWRGSSRLEDIASGLAALVEELRRLGVHSIALPPLGCGLGGLSWDQVRPLIEEAFSGLSDVDVQLFAPVGAPAANAMPIRTSPPEMTVARALLLKLMDQYAAMDYRLTLLEIQKLAYFLQESGEPLRLRYEPGHYGPYAPNLNKVLERIEGHFTRGYGDSQRPDVEIELLPGAVEKAAAFLEAHPESCKRLARVAALIAGFETPYGMELLSSLHWVYRRGDPHVHTFETAATAVHAWNSRKRRMLKTDHLQVAWDQLAACGWLN